MRRDSLENWIDGLCGLYSAEWYYTPIPVSSSSTCPVVLHCQVFNCFSLFITAASVFISKPKLEIVHMNISINIIVRVFLIHLSKSPFKVRLRQHGLRFSTNSSPNTCASLFQACTDIRALNQVHAHMLVTGLHHDIFSVTRLVNMYAECGSLDSARLVFDKIYKRDIFLWNVMIREYARAGLCEETLALYSEMRRAGIEPDNFTFPFVLKACAGLSALQEGKQVHYHIVKAGFQSHIFVETALIDMYAKCGNVEDARQVFDKMSRRDVCSWSAMVAGYAQSGHASEALMVFNQMLLEGMVSDSVTMVSVVQACANLKALQQGEWIHGYAIKSGFESYVSLGNSLVDMYAKCGNLEVARQLFEKMSERNVISWSAMIAGYAQNGRFLDALGLFNQMQLTSVKPNPVTMVSVISVYARLGALQQGRSIHDYIIRCGFESNAFVGNSLIDMYAKCGSVEDARQVFDKMSQRNVVSWNAMIAGYAQNGHFNEALTLFHQMQLACMTPDSVSVVSVISACAHLGALEQGKRIHDYIIRSRLELNVFVVNSLIDVYSKFGKIQVAYKLFDQMSKRDAISWNAMIAGYAQNGHASEALMLFHQMQLAEVAPDSVTMVGVLLACAHLGALQQGKLIHNYVIKSGFEADAFVGTSLIDMYAKCGRIEIARNFFDKMSKRNEVPWSAMIGGYGMHGHGEDAIALFYQMQQTGVKPNHITFICVLSACSHAGLVDEGWQHFESMSRDYCITPRVEHYACMVDLLGRAGRLDDAQVFIKNMPIEPNAGVWGALLGACRIHCNIDLGERVAECLFNLEPENAGFYVLLSNIYAAAGRWNDVGKVRTMMKDRALTKTPGCSFIELNNRVHCGR